MNNREQYHPFAGMSPHDRIEDMKRRFHEKRTDPRMFGIPSYVGSPHDRMSPFFERTFSRQTPPPSGERTVPINVQHQNSANQSSSNPNSQQQQHEPNQDEQPSQQTHYYDPKNDFYPGGFSKFSTNPEFFNFRRPEFGNRMREPSADEKVHHIPIHVETRNGNTPQQPPPTQQPQQQHHQPNQYQSNNDVNNHQSAGDTWREVSPQNHQYQQSQPQQQPYEETHYQPQQQRQYHPQYAQQQQPKQYHPQNHRLASSQNEIPIQIVREEASKQNKAPPQPQQEEQQQQQEQQQESAKKPEEATPIPMPYAPLNSTTKFPESGKESSSSSSSSCGNETNPPAVKKNTPRDCIDQILDDTKNYEQQVDTFTGTPNDKTYKYLDEMLTRCILKLDDICIDGNDELRKYRKAAINEVNRVTSRLESKVSSKNESPKNNVQESGSAPLAGDETSQQEECNDNANDNKTVNKSASDKSVDGTKKEKPKKKKLVFFKSSKKANNNNTATDTNNNAVPAPKETDV